MKIRLIYLSLYLITFTHVALAQNLSEEKAGLYSQPAFAVFTPFRSGMVIKRNSVFYNAANGSVRLGVGFKNVHEAFFGENMSVYVNGRDIFELDPLGASLSSLPPVAPNIYGEMGGSLDFSVGADKNYPLISALFELVHHDTGVVVAREKLVMYQTVNDDDIGFVSGGSDEEGRGFQLSVASLAGEPSSTFSELEAAVSDGMPYPSADTFNANLSQQIRRLPSRTEEDLEVCVDYDDFDEQRLSDPQEFAAYNRAKNEALAIYAGYIACQTSGGKGCKSACVRKPPTSSGFQLCVNKMQSFPIGGGVGQGHEAQFSFQNSTRANSGTIAADLRLREFYADIDVELSELSVKWKKPGLGLCIFNAKANVQEEEIASTPWLEDFTRCAGSVNAAYAEANGNKGSQYQLKPSRQNKGAIDVTEKRAAKFKLHNTQVDADNAACSQATLNELATEMVNFYSPKLAKKLDRAVKYASPKTGLAVTLQALLASTDIADIGTAEVLIKSTIKRLETSTTDGLSLIYDTDVLPDLSISRGTLNPTYFSQYADDFRPYTNSIDGNGLQAASVNSVSVPWLNNLLWAKGFSSLLNGTLTFSAAQLQTSAYGAQTQQFSGQVLSDLSPALKYLSNETVEVAIYRNLDPFFYMEPDPDFTVTNVGHRMAMFLDEVRLVVKAPDEILPNGNKVPGQRFITMLVSLHEPNAYLTLPADDALSSYFALEAFPYKDANAIFNQFNLGIIDFDSPECPKFKHTLIPSGTNCERELEAKLRQFFAPTLLSILEQTFGQTPVVNQFHFDAGKESITLNYGFQSVINGNGRTYHSSIEVDR